MATFTWVDLQITEAATLADLSGILWDLQRAREIAEMLAGELKSEKTNWKLVEPLSIAAIVMYSRPFASGVRYHLREEDLVVLSPAQRAVHDYLRAYRDKHVAHSVNAFEENIPRANYCLERVNEEGIISVSCGGGRVTGLSTEEVGAIIELTNVFEIHVRTRISGEQDRLLPIVRSLPLEDILRGGQKAFVLHPNNNIADRRKR